MPGLNDLCRAYWDLYLADRPTFASVIGRHEYDGEVEDPSPPARAAHMASLRHLRRELEEVDADDDPITRDLLAANLEADLAEAETQITVWPVDPNLGLHSSLLRYTAQTQATEPSHAKALADRFRQVPGMLYAALARHRQLAAAGLAPAAASVRRTLDQLDAYLESGTDTDPFVSLSLPSGWEGAEAWRAEMEDIVTRSIRPAASDYRQGVAELLEEARPDETPGICHLPDGNRIYPRLVERFVTVAYDPGDIHVIGREHATRSLISEYARAGSEAFGASEHTEIFERLRTDSTLRYSSAQEMLEHAREIVARAWAAIDGWLGARPDGPCRVEPVPAALAKDMPPAYYLQPSPDGSRPGIYFLNTHAPHTRDRFMAEATAFHEAIPGHHFDRALATALTGLADFRRFRFQTVHAEGWGLYAERLADEMGLYSAAVDRLGMLTADSWRATRLVVDTGIHHHGWSRDEAIRFMVDWTPINRPTIEQEVDRYIGWPGQALSYKMGQIEIARLRSRAEEHLGERFDLVGFHDAVLTSGSLTIPLLERTVTRWMEGVTEI